MNEIIFNNRDKISDIGREYGVTEIRLFGSFLHGTNNDDSDIDFLVEFEDNRDMLDLIGFKFHMEDLLGRKVDVVTKASIHKDIADYVLQESKLI